MRRLWVAVLALCVSTATLGGHYWLTTPAVPADSSTCEAASAVCGEGCEEPVAAVGYWRSGRAFLGLSYALALGFFVYVLAHSIARRRGAGKSLLAGVTLAGALWLGVCWLVGCCSSPLLPVYVALFGARFFGVTAPLAFGLTAASVAVGAVWFRRVARKECGCVK